MKILIILISCIFFITIFPCNVNNNGFDIFYSNNVKEYRVKKIELQPRTRELQPRTRELQPRTRELQPRTRELQPKK